MLYRTEHPPTFEPSSQQFEQSFSGALTSAPPPSPSLTPSNSRFDNSTKPSSSLLNNLISFLEELLADQGRHNNLGLFVTQLVNLFIGSLTSVSASTNHYSDVNGGLIDPPNSQFYASYRTEMIIMNRLAKRHFPYYSGIVEGYSVIYLRSRFY